MKRKLKKKVIIALNILMALTLIVPQTFYAQRESVTVNIPQFKVSLNNVQVDNEYRKYPLITYKNITYFPMTYYDSRFLGLETNWNKEQGLRIEKTGITSGYRDYKGNTKNKRIYQAKVRGSDIRINGKTIDNSKEKYPLLTFRDITYFPLTWKFAVEEFAWDYKFDSINGLQVQSSNSKVEKVVLPGFDGKQITGDGEYYYYGGEDGKIYQVKKDGKNEPKKVYDLPIWSGGYDDNHVRYKLYRKDGDIWLEYHQGGATMGTDFYIRLNPDGSSEEVQTGYLTFKSYDNMTILAKQWIPPSSNNLSVKHGEEDFKNVGDPAYLYGWDWEREGTSEGGSGSEDIYFYNNSIYLLAFNRESDTDFSRIHKVDLDTNETKRVSDLRARKFVLDKDSIYFPSSGNLYEISLKDGKENHIEVEGEVEVKDGIEVLNNRIYYVNSLDGELYRNGENVSLNPGGKVNFIKEDEGYIISTFEERPETDIRTIVFDKNGEKVFKSSDTLEKAFINGDELVYLEESSKNVYRVKLDIKH